MPVITSIGEILFDIYKDEKRLGGAPFNFVYHILKITGKGNFISRIGKDELGQEITAYLSEHKISTDLIQIDDKHPTGKAVANLDENKIPHWEIENNCAYDFIEKTDEVDRFVSGSDCLYFGTLAQRNPVTRESVQSLFNKNIKYFCDLNIRQDFYSRRIIEASLKASDVLKLNEDELILVNNLFIKDTYEIISSAIKLRDFFGIDLLCVTCGENGSYLFRNEDIDYCKTNVTNVVDTVGAGDAYAAILCLGYLNNLSLKTVNEIANKFAGEIVKIKGALPPDDEIYEKFKVKAGNER
jgi:fructokinase